MKIALVYDRVNKVGGAERVLATLHEIWPDAPLFTAVYDPGGAPWAEGWDVRPSFLNSIPFARRHHELFAWATPFAFESFSFDDYDVVLSVTSAEAKYVITKPHTFHICYCLTPTRYLWSGIYEYTTQSSGLFKRLYQWVLPTLQRWDLVGSARPDVYAAISRRVADRIDAYYHRNVEKIIYPPVDVETFKVKSEKLKTEGKEEYYLVVSRLVGYKRIDLVVEAFNELGWPLVVIGDGAQRSTLMRTAKSNIRFVPGGLTDDSLAHYYQHCRAFVFAGDEDFGIVAAEALACGKPIIAYKLSGIAEIVQDGKTGILFDKQTKDSMMEALVVASKRTWDEKECRRSVEVLSQARFRDEMKRFVEGQYAQYKLS